MRHELSSVMVDKFLWQKMAVHVEGEVAVRHRDMYMYMRLKVSPLRSDKNLLAQHRVLTVAQQ